MSKPVFLAVATAAAVATLAVAAAPSAEAHRYRHRHGGVSVVIGAPFLYGGYGYYSPRYYGPSYYRSYEPVCRRWGWVHSRSGRAKWRCIAW
jgi:hypothetical protein